MQRRQPVALAAAGALVLGVAAPAAASHDVTPARVAGDTRFATAADIADLQHPDGSDHAIVANGRSFPDALAGAPAATHFGAPVLLVEQDQVPDETAQALADLDVDGITVLGGPAAVSEDVEAELAQSQRAEVDRLRGEDRYETAAAIARAVQGEDNPTNHVGGHRAAFVASGQSFPDALSAGAVAAKGQGEEIPVLLSTADEVPAPTEQVVEDHQFDLVYLVGGEGVLSEQVRDTLEDDDTEVVRLAGDTRTATAAAVADHAMEFLDFDAVDTELARGDDFADALAVAPLAGQDQSPLLLTRTPAEASQPTLDWYAEQCDTVERVRAVGGEAAVATSTLNATEVAAEECHGPDETEQTYTVTPQERITAAPGDSREFEVIGRYDTEDEVATPLDVVLFPCDAVQEPVDGEFRFRDDNEDGRADGIESTETGAARIVATNGEAITPDTGVRDVQPTGDPATIAATFEADAQDCAAVVFFEDTQNNSALDVDTDGLPTEPWGFGLVEWTS